MSIEAIRKFNADLMERSITSDRKTFTRDVTYMADLATDVLSQASQGRIRVDQLVSLSQRVNALLVLGSKIDASTEMHKVLTMDLAEKN